MCFQKPHRLLPTNLYVILYNFKARHPDELDLKAGYKVSQTQFDFSLFQILVMKRLTYNGFIFFISEH